MAQVHFSTRSLKDNSARKLSRLRWLGVFWITLGIVAIATSFAATLATMLIFAVLLVMAGVAQLAHAWSSPSPDSSWEVLTGLTYLLVGGILVLDPVNGAIGLTFLIGILLLFRGAVQMAMAASGRRFGRSPLWYFIGGLLSLLLAVLILTSLPQAGMWLIGVFVGTELLLGGAVLLLTPEIVIEQEVD